LLASTAKELVVFHVVMDVLVVVLGVVAVDDEAVAELVEELQDRDLDRVELTISEQGIERVLHDALVLGQEVIGEDLCEHVPTHDSESGISTRGEADKPSTLFKVLQVFSCCAA